MTMDNTSKNKPKNTICLRSKRLEKSKRALSRHAVAPTVFDNHEDDRKEKLTSLVGKIRFAQNRAKKHGEFSQSGKSCDDKPLWEVD
ncbi:MAG: hypothetical protein ACPF9K_04725 [Neptuniibacter sp.]